jgi:triosephosphate isomerase
MRKAVVNIARMVLAVVLIISGFVKAVDPMGTQYKLADYLTALHLQMLTPDFLTLGASVILSALEFGLGICLLFAIRKVVSTSLTLLMMLFMTPLTLWVALADPVSDCGCFGDAIVLTNWQSFGKNVVLLIMAYVVWKWPHDMVRLISTSSQWIAVNYSAIFILAVSGWSLYDLPYLDFRPYHVGTDLRKGWQQMMNGEESPYAEFFIQRADDGEDITDSLLSSKGYLFLLVAPHVEQADDSQLDLINQMYEYAEDNNYPFYALTASGEKGIERWRDMTGAEYPFCQTDEITLKTIIRSNPGLLLLKDGVIIRKWSHNNLPDEYALTDRLEKLKIGSMSKESMTGKILIIALWYILPLLLLTIADRLWAWSKWLKRKEQSNKIYQLFKKKTENEKENRSRQLEDEPEPARGCGSGQGTE